MKDPLNLPNGYHSIRERLLDFLEPTGNNTGIDCLLSGHKWYLDRPCKDDGIPLFSSIKYNEFPDRWLCLCRNCGAGSVFVDIPNEAIGYKYQCGECSEIYSGTEIIEHTKNYFNETSLWPEIRIIS